MRVGYRTELLQRRCGLRAVFKGLRGIEGRALNAQQLRDYVITPTLSEIRLWSPSAEQLLLATAAHESHCGEYLKQIGGRAVGIFQCEPATHRDIFENYLFKRQDLYQRVMGLLPDFLTNPTGYVDDINLIGNLFYATAICRIHYLRVPEPMPRLNDMDAMADYWGRHYQTDNNAEKKQQFREDWAKYVAPVYR